MYSQFIWSLRAFIKVKKAVRVSPKCLTKPGSETVQSNCDTYLVVIFISA